MLAAWPEETRIEREQAESPFTVAEVVIALQHLKARRAAGPDGITNELLKDALGLAPCWTALFNECLQQGTVPAKWTEAEVISIPKARATDPRDPKAWRGIALKNCTYKPFTDILARRLTTFLEKIGAFPGQQHGFRSGRYLSEIERLHCRNSTAHHGGVEALSFRTAKKHSLKLPTKRDNRRGTGIKLEPKLKPAHIVFQVCSCDSLALVSSSALCTSGSSDGAESAVMTLSVVNAVVLQ